MELDLCSSLNTNVPLIEMIQYPVNDMLEDYFF